MRKGRTICMAMGLATLLFVGVEASAQRAGSTSRSSSSSVRGTSTRNTSSSRDQSTASSSVRSSRVEKQESTPALQSRGAVKTGTNNRSLRPSSVSPSRNYKSLPTRGTKVTKFKATSNSHVVKYGGVDYYYKKGVFYHYDCVQNHYVVSRPPLGMRVSVIPQSRIIYLDDVNYYYYYGVFYRRVASEYEVVAPPVGAIVESIPNGYEQLVVNGNTYYIVDGVQYKAVVYHGEIWYEVIKIMD